MKIYLFDILNTDMKERSLLHDSLNEIFLGSVSGACGKLIEYPFDTIKVRLQYSQSLDNQLYNSTFHAIKQTFLNEGIVNGFYKGLKIPLMGAALEASCLFFSYNIAQDFIKLALQGNTPRRRTRKCWQTSIRCIQWYCNVICIDSYRACQV